MMLGMDLYVDMSASDKGIEGIVEELANRSVTPDSALDASGPLGQVPHVSALPSVRSSTQARVQPHSHDLQHASKASVFVCFAGAQ